MPNWNAVLGELNKEGEEGPVDRIRRKYLSKLSNYTKRNIIAYYSGWLQKPGIIGANINDSDINGFMTTIHQLDKRRGLDLILHTPGGDLAATESIVRYLRKIFEIDIRIIVPHLAMSAGTMIACAGREIIMGAHSNLGPIDPQFNSISAEGVLEEFKRAKDETSKDPRTIPMWQMIIGKYHPTFIGDCEKSITWSKNIVSDWLRTGMFKDDINADAKIAEILKVIASHEATSSHARHISADACKEMGLHVTCLEDDAKLQDLVLTVHHAFMHTFSGTDAIKITENHIRRAMVHFAQNKPR